MFDEDDLLPLSALQHLVFCERRFALVHIESLWADDAATVAGAGFHKRVDDTAPRIESRGDQRICRGLLLRSFRLGLSGKADAVELLRGPPESASRGPSDPARHAGYACSFPGAWNAFPIEYKSGRLRHEHAYEVQLCAQALCLEEMLGGAVGAGALYYGKTRRRVVVRFDTSLRDATEAAARRLHELFDARLTPPAVRNARCRRCSMASLCLPSVTCGRRSATRYLESALRRAAADV